MEDFRFLGVWVGGREVVGWSGLMERHKGKGQGGGVVLSCAQDDRA